MKLYTTGEVAQILKVDIETVRRFVREGKIIAHKVGREWRVKEVGVERFLEENKNIEELEGNTKLGKGE